MKNSVFRGRKKPWQPQTWQDLTRFSPLDVSLLSPDFGGLFLLNYTENLENKLKIQWRAPSEDGAPKLQISVPCRGRTCPEFWIAIGAAIYRSPEALWARNRQKVSKRCSRASRPGVSKKCRKSPKWPEKETFSTLFCHSRRGGPGSPFWDFLGISGSGGVETPVYGDCTRKFWTIFLSLVVVEGALTLCVTYKLSGPVRDTPPLSRKIPFRDSIAEGGIAPICLVFIGYRASIAEIPLFWRRVEVQHQRWKSLREPLGGNCPLEALRGFFFSRNSHRRTSERSS